MDISNLCFCGEIRKLLSRPLLSGDMKAFFFFFYLFVLYVQKTSTSKHFIYPMIVIRAQLFKASLA